MLCYTVVYYATGGRSISVPEVMINRDSWGHSYLIVRGEILGFVKDGLLRMHLPRMCSLIKNESYMLYYAILYYTMLYCTVLCYTVLYYTIIQRTILYYTTLTDLY